MTTTIKKEFKKSSIRANNDYDFYQIERKSNYLLNCTITKAIDVLTFEFFYESERPYKDLKDLSLLLKYRTLINIQYLFEDSKRINISLNPDNIMLDLNMMPKIIMRDVYETGTYDTDDFLRQYKALIGYTLQSKYAFVDFYEGGSQLLAKQKITTEYKDIATLNGLVESLNSNYEKLLKTFQTSIVEVDKKKYKRIKSFNKLYIVLLIITISIGGFFGVYKLLEAKTFNRAYEAYIKQDYISVVETLNEISTNQMNKNTKYILAISNVKVESLNTEQKNNILSSISLNSDERILDFWAYIGKSDLDESIDIAKQLGNKEYIAYAYMKQKSQVENDTSISGSQREEKLKEIESSIKELDLLTTNETDTKK